MDRLFVDSDSIRCHARTDNMCNTERRRASRRGRGWCGLHSVCHVRLAKCARARMHCYSCRVPNPCRVPFSCVYCGCRRGVGCPRPVVTTRQLKGQWCLWCLASVCCHAGSTRAGADLWYDVKRRDNTSQIKAKLQWEQFSRSQGPKQGAGSPGGHLVTQHVRTALSR